MEKQNERLKSEASICTSQLKKHLDSKENGLCSEGEREKLQNIIESQKSHLSQLTVKSTNLEIENKSLKSEKLELNNKYKTSEASLKDLKNKHKNPTQNELYDWKAEVTKLRKENTILKQSRESTINNLADKKNKDIMKKLADMTSHQSRMESKMKEILETVKISPGVPNIDNSTRPAKPVMSRNKSESKESPRKSLRKTPIKRKPTAAQSAFDSNSDSDLDSLQCTNKTFKKPRRKSSSGHAIKQKKQHKPCGPQQPNESNAINTGNLSNSGSSSDNDIDLVGQLENSFKVISPANKESIDDTILCDPLPQTSEQFDIFNGSPRIFPQMPIKDPFALNNTTSNPLSQKLLSVKSIFDIMISSDIVSPLICESKDILTAKSETFIIEPCNNNSHFQGTTSTIPLLPLHEKECLGPDDASTTHIVKSPEIMAKSLQILPEPRPELLTSSPMPPSFQTITIKNEKYKTKSEASAPVLTIGPVTHHQRMAPPIVSTLSDVFSSTPIDKSISINGEHVKVDKDIVITTVQDKDGGSWRSDSFSEKELSDTINISTLNPKLPFSRQEESNDVKPIVNLDNNLITSNPILNSDRHDKCLNKTNDVYQASEDSSTPILPTTHIDEAKPINVKPLIDIPASSGEMVGIDLNELSESGKSQETNAFSADTGPDKTANVIYSDESMFCAFEMDIGGQSSQSSQSEGETQSDSTIETDETFSTKYFKRMARVNKMLTIDGVFEKSEISFVVPEQRRTRTSTSQNDLLSPSSKSENTKDQLKLRRSSRKSSQSHSDNSCGDAATSQIFKKPTEVVATVLSSRHSSSQIVVDDNLEALANKSGHDESNYLQVDSQKIESKNNEKNVVVDENSGKNKNENMPSQHFPPENIIQAIQNDIPSRNANDDKEHPILDSELSMSLMIIDNSPVMKLCPEPNDTIESDVNSCDAHVDVNINKIDLSLCPEPNEVPENAAKACIALPVGNWFTSRDLDLDLTPITKKSVNNCGASAVLLESEITNDMSPGKQTKSRKRKKTTAPKISSGQIFDLFIPAESLSRLICPVDHIENSLSIVCSDHDIDSPLDMDSGAPSCASSTSDNIPEPIASVDLHTLNLIKKPSIPATSSVDDEPLVCSSYEDYSHITSPKKITRHFINLFRKNLCTNCPNIPFLCETMIFNHKNKCLQNPEGKLAMVIKNEISIINSCKDTHKPPVDVLVEFFFSLLCQLENSDYSYFNSGELKKKLLKALFWNVISMKKAFCEPLSSLLTFAIKMSLKCHDLSHLRSYVIKTILSVNKFQFCTNLFQTSLNNYSIFLLIGAEQLCYKKGGSLANINHVYLAGLEFYLRFSQIKCTSVEQLSYIHQFAVENHLINAAIDAVTATSEDHETQKNFNSEVRLL